MNDKKVKCIQNYMASIKSILDHFILIIQRYNRYNIFCDLYLYTL